MKPYQNLLLIFLGIFVGTFGVYGVMALLNHNTFQSVIIHTLAASGVIITFILVMLAMMFGVNKLLNKFDKSKKIPKNIWRL